MAPLLPVRVAVIAKHVALALALAASAALFIDYQNAGDPAFCGAASGCFAVRVSAYSHLLGIPLPNLALPAFAILLGGSLLARTVDHHRFVAIAAGAGGLAGLALIAIQAFFVGAFCPWCIIVDSSALICAFSAIALWFWIGDSEEHARQASVRGSGAVAWGLAGALSVGLPFLWAQYPVIPPVPPEIQAEQQPGKVTIVSFTDFECPFCRKLHPLLDQLREKHADRIHFVRKMKPLSGHVGAMPAARAYFCAPEKLRDQLATALYDTDPGQLTDKKLVELADRFDLGGRAALEQCMQAKTTEEAIERDAAVFAKISGRGLPLTWVNGRVVMGLNPTRLVAAVDEELGGPRPALPLSILFALLGVAIAAAGFVTWRGFEPTSAPRSAKAPEPDPPPAAAA